MPEAGRPQDRQENPEVQHERRDVHIAGILAAAGGLIVAAVVIHFVVWWMFQHMASREKDVKGRTWPLGAGEAQLPPEPRLEGLERLPLEQAEVRPRGFVETKQPQPEGYAWVDRQNGIIRIPIDRAMKIMVERKLLKSRPAEPTAPLAKEPDDNKHNPE